MSLITNSFLDICVKRYQALSPRNQQRMADRWDLYTAMQLHTLLAQGCQEEQAAAAAHDANELYEVMGHYFDTAAQEVAEEAPAVTSFALDHDLYNKLVYMAKHGLHIKAGDLP